MAKNPQLKADQRTVMGRKVKQLRRQGLVPANVFGKKVTSIAITLDTIAFTKLYEQVGDTGLIDLQIGEEKQTRPVLVSHIHYDPVAESLLHVDFHQVDLTETVTAMVPVEIVGEAPAVKEHGGVLITSMDEVEVEALPQNLPDKFEVDVSGLTELNDMILIKELKVDRAKVTILAEEEAAVISIQPPKEEEEEPAPEVETEEGGDEAAQTENQEGKEASTETKTEE